MHKLISLAAMTLLVVAAAAPADDYDLDAMHTAATFKISHIGLSWTHGRFNDVSGSFSINPDPAACAFALTIKTDSLDTANQKRDQHLKSPDFFNTKQFPTITFKSTSVKSIKDGYEVTGDLTLHGVSKAVTFSLVGGRKAEFPKGVQRTGFSTELVLKRGEFGMTKFAEAVGDDVHVSISFEGTRK